MNNLGLHMRISGVAVSDNDVESRRNAANSLSTKWGKEKNTSNIVAKAAAIASSLGGDGKPPVSLGEEVQEAIQKKAPAFLYDERPLDVGVCAGMASVSLMQIPTANTGWQIVDVYAAALWSALAFQPALADDRREKLRIEVFETAADVCSKSAEKARERNNVPDVAEVTIKMDDNNVITNDCKDALEDSIIVLRRNAALDREELDFLWWAQLGRSRILKKQLSGIDEPKRIVTTAVEAAKILRRLPAEVHREIVLRTLDQNAELDLSELLTAIGDDRDALVAASVKPIVNSNPIVFPLLHALATTEVSGAGASLKRSISEWGERALLETTFAKLLSEGPGKI